MIRTIGIRSVPRCFDSKMLLDYRETKQRREVEIQCHARAVLDDPQATAHDREWATDVLKAG